MDASLPPATGLTSAEARSLLRRHGANELHPAPPRSFWRELARRLRSPLTAILLAASLVMAFTGDVAGCLVVIVIVALSVAIDLFQEHRADRAAQALIARVQVHATVLRDGRPVSVPVRRVVPGDAIVLRAGSIVPADGRLVESNGLHVNEALLTGEAFPVEKRVGGEPAAGRLFLGSSVVSGSGLFVAERTGRDTQVGALAGTLAAPRPPTAFENALHGFGLLIMRLTAFMVLFVVLVNTALHRPLLESFLFAVALAVGLTPELLPMIVTVTLSRGALRLAHEHVIVKRLLAIEGLGAMDVLCTDKTGTLTQSKLHVDRAIDLWGRPSEAALEAAAANSAAQAGITSPLDAALLERRAGVAAPIRIAEIPFDFERRRVAVLVEEHGRRRILVKGAPESLVECCERQRSADGREGPWTDADREAARARLAALGEEGLHVIGVASREVGPAEARVGEEGLVFLGFVAFSDPPKAGAAAALKALAESGVRVKILTGDEPTVTRHVCATLGLEVTGVLTGEDVGRLDGPALAARVEGANLFCRLTPMQKERIVRMLRARGHVVGYLGDGINDAPAMHAADVGLSVENAVDVAREAADLILLRHDLAVLHRGVLEGRRTFANIRKYLLMGTSSNFGNMASMAGASLLLPFLPMLPAQVLVNNLLYDVSEIPIPLDRADDRDVATPQRWDLSQVRNFMWTMGPVSSLFDFITFWILLRLFEGDEALFRTGWFVESLATQVLVIFVIRTRASPLSSHPAPALAATSLAVVGIATALPWTPMGPLLGFTPLPASFLLVVAGLTACYLAVAEFVKRSFYKARG